MKQLSAAVLMLSAMCGAALAEPQHIVSLNPCLDVILVNVADREQIAALSHYSLDQISSTIPDIAKTLPSIHESAEEIILLKPDLVLTSRHSALATRKALNRLQIKTELFTEPKDVDSSIAQVRYIAGLVNRAERGEALIQKIEESLKAAAPPVGARPIGALIFQRNGFSTGKDTLANEMLQRTGFENVSHQYGLTGWGNIPLERVVINPPQVLLDGALDPNMPTWADRVMRHPALRELKDQMQRVTFPDRYFFCGGPVLIEASHVLMNARQSVLRAQTPPHAD